MPRHTRGIDPMDKSASPHSLFRPIAIGMEKLFVTPEVTDTTRIATLLSRCVVPVRLNVFSVPDKLLAFIEEKSHQSESLLPLAAVGIYQKIRHLRYRMFAPDFFPDIDDVIDLFMSDAVRQANYFTDRFCVCLSEICDEILNIKEQIASEKAFFMSRVLGTEATIDPSLIVTAIQNFFMALNILASGMDGYIILALVKAIDTIGKLLQDPQIHSVHHVLNQTALLNTLGFRLLPGHVAFDKHISEMLTLSFTMERSRKLGNDDILRLLTLADHVKRGLTQLPARTTPFQGPSSMAVHNEPPLEPAAIGISSANDETTKRMSAADLKPNTLNEMIGKNVLLKRHTEKTPAPIEIGHIVAVVYKYDTISDDTCLRYFGKLSQTPVDATKPSSNHRVIICLASGNHIIVPVDNDFYRTITVM